MPVTLFNDVWVAEWDDVIAFTAKPEQKDVIKARVSRVYFFISTSGIFIYKEFTMAAGWRNKFSTQFTNELFTGYLVRMTSLSVSI